jgi:hypothetical protein
MSAMLTPSDQSQSAPAFGPLRLQDPAADIGRAERRPTWWLGEEEHARLLGVKPRAAKLPKATATKPAVRPRTETPPPAPEKAEAAPIADFAALVPTLASLDRILQPLAADVPGLAPLLSAHRIKRIGRFGAAFGLATIAAAVVFFR